MPYNFHAGHCPQGKGANGAVGLVYESTEARLVKDEAIRLMRADGHTTYDCTCDVSKSQQGCLDYIINLCNQHSVDSDYSIHLNSGRNDYHGDTKTGGVEVIIFDEGMRDIAERIANNIAREFGYNLRSDKTSPCPGVKINKSLRVLKETKAPAALIECCFVDDADDIRVWDAKRCAKAIVEGILNKKISQGGSGVDTVRRISPGSAHLYCDAPIMDDKGNVIINGKAGDHITVLDHGTTGVMVRHNSTVGYMECKYVMPDIAPNDKLRTVKEITVTIPKGTILTSQDSGWAGNIVNGNFIIESKSVEKV